MKNIIVVIDDQSDIRSLILLTLDYGEYVIYEADSGVSGLALVKKIKPDLVILDVMMPGELDGYQVCKEMREDPTLSDTAVLMLTARAQVSDLKIGHDIGCTAYLTKPFSPLKLIENVEAILYDRKK